VIIVLKDTITANVKQYRFVFHMDGHMNRSAGPAEYSIPPIMNRALRVLHLNALAADGTTQLNERRTSERMLSSGEIRAGTSGQLTTHWSLFPWDT
jgi:hypothetical protein